MYDQLDHLLGDHQRYHSAYQIDHFITAKSGGTTWGMYRQALRELSSRAATLQDSYLSLREIEIDIEELVAVERTKRQEIELLRKRISFQAARDGMADKEREFGHFYSQAVALKASLGPLTPERRDALDREFWAFQARRKALLELVCNGQLSTGTLDMIWSLEGDDSQAVQADLAAGPRALEAWLQSHQGPSLALDQAARRVSLNGAVRSAIECLVP